MTKFKVGDKVRFIEKFGEYSKGDEVTIKSFIDTDHVKFKGEYGTGDVYTRRLELVKTSKNQRITTLENEVAELKLIVHELRGKKSIEPSTTNTVEDIIEFEGQQYKKVDREAREGDVVTYAKPKQIYLTKDKPYKVLSGVLGMYIEDDDNDRLDVYNKFSRTPETVSVYELIQPKPLTPNQQRAAIIEKAKKFVEKVSSRQSCWTVNEIGNETYRQKCTVNEFIINNEKRTVVVLVKGEDSGKIFEKGIAKCNPNDVFNEHIGKAIALGRALGLDVSEFEQAVQPTEIISGMEIMTFTSDKKYHKSGVVNYYDELDDSVLFSKWELHGELAWDNDYTGLVRKHGYRILNDTNAIYEVES